MIIRNKRKSLLILFILSDWKEGLLAAVSLRCTSLIGHAIDDPLITDHDSAPALDVLLGICLSGSIIAWLNAQIDLIPAELIVDLLGLHDQAVLLLYSVLENLLLHGQCVEQIDLLGRDYCILEDKLLHVSNDTFVVHVLAKGASEDRLLVLVLLLLCVLDVATLGLQPPQMLSLSLVDATPDWLESCRTYF